MAIRVTEQEVLDIMDSGIEVSSTQMTAMITAASSVIDNVFADDSTVTDALLKELERWLSAHYVASTLARMAEKEKVGQAEVTYMGKWGEMLNQLRMAKFYLHWILPGNWLRLVRELLVYTQYQVLKTDGTGTNNTTKPKTESCLLGQSAEHGLWGIYI